MAELINIHMASDLSEWSSTTTDAGDLSWAAGAGLGGTSGGMSLLIDDTTSLLAYKEVTPSTTGRLRVRFYFDPNSLTMAANDEFMITQGRSSNVFFLLAAFINYSGGYRIRCAIYNDGGGAANTNYYALTDEPHYIELDLKRATNSTSADGSLELFLDGVSKETKGGVDNYDAFVDFYRMYFTAANIDAGTSGTFYLDELVCNDDGTLIGPVAAGGTAVPVFMNQYRQRAA